MVHLERSHSIPQRKEGNKTTLFSWCAAESPATGGDGPWKILMAAIGATQTRPATWRLPAAGTECGTTKKPQLEKAAYATIRRFSYSETSRVPCSWATRASGSPTMGAEWMAPVSGGVTPTRFSRGTPNTLQRDLAGIALWRPVPTSPGCPQT